MEGTFKSWIKDDISIMYVWSYESFVNGNQGWSSKTRWNFRNRPIVFFTLVKIVLTWMSKDNFKSKWNPKWKKIYFRMKNFLGWIFLVVAFLIKMTSWVYFVGSGLKPIFHWKAHLFISFRSLLRLLAVLSGSLTVENRDVSSANNLGLDWTISD